jgi:threonine dehydratase
VAYSSGNHAQGVALAARLLGIEATIVMPTDAPTSKRRATEAYGAKVRTYDRQRERREDVAAQLAEENGLVVVPSYDDPAIMAGQGTVALELLEQVGDLDAIVTPLGGGGLLSGCAAATKGLSRRTRLFGVEPAAGDDWVRSLSAGHPVRIPPPATIADGVRTEQPGRYTFPVVRDLVEDVLVVSDDEIRAAMRFLLLRMKLLVEPTGAIPLALMLSGRLRLAGRSRVGLVLSGGNVDADVVAGLLGEH